MHSSKQSVLAAVLGSVGWALAGALAGATFERLLLKSLFADFESAVLVLLAVAIVLLCSLTTVAGVLLNRHQREVIARDETAQRVIERLGTPAELVVERRSEAKGVIYGRLMSLVAMAGPEDEIIVMTNVPQSGLREETNEAATQQQARSDWYNLLILKAGQQHVKYRRVSMFDEGPDKGKVNSPYLRPVDVEHCQEMLQIRERSPHLVSLKKSRSVFASDVVLIRGKTAAVGIEVVDKKTGHRHTDAALIFHDPPNSEILHRLYDFFPGSRRGKQVCPRSARALVVAN